MSDTSEKVAGAQCVNCRTTFTVEAAVKHSEPGVCVEWSNHQMYEANFTIAFVDPATVDDTP